MTNPQDRSATATAANPLFDLRGRRALVTGSSRGIGLALTAALGRAGAAVVLNGRDPATLAAAREPLAAQGVTADWRRIVDTNLTSVFLASKAVAQGMIARRRGKIVNILSVNAEAARASIAPYSATKGALRMLTKGMCVDWARHGIQVNGLAPGYFDTELTRPLVADPEFSASIAKRVPAGRWGQVEELGGAAVFLASRASDFVNGHVLFVDGGMTASL